MIEDRQEDEGPLEDADEGQAVEELDLIAIGDRPFERFEVGEQVFKKKSADGDDAEKGVELAEEEFVPLGGAERRHALADSRRCGMLGSCHECVGS